jgi:ABC-type dipeptide/oligopeptide/nickel transport system permease component
MPFSDIVAVSGLLLTLTTFMFNLAWPKISEALALDEYQSGPQLKKRSRQKVQDAFYWRALPLTCAFIALFYVNLPAAVRIIRSSTLDFWDFDVDRTLFVMVVTALLVFALINAGLTVKLLKKWRSLH